MVNLAHAYEAQGDWGDARQTYEALRSHYPNDAGLQAKIKELSDKH